jgi:HK97 gp10 family phage protein
MATVRSRSRLPQIAAQLQARIDTAVRAGAEAVSAQAKQRVPVESGALRDAIHVERGGVGEYTVVAGDREAFYGHLVEFGTVHTPPRPFLVPAAEASRDEITAAARTALRGL